VGVAIATGTSADAELEGVETTGCREGLTAWLQAPRRTVARAAASRRAGWVMHFVRSGFAPKCST
jgi:hypothetical protein